MQIALPPLAPAYGEIRPTFWELHGTIIIIAVAIFLVLLCALVWFIARPKPTVALPPQVLALESLTELRRQPENGKTLSAISQTLNRYFNAAFHLPAGQKTTGEFTAALADDPVVGAPLAQSVSTFLRECDQRKFSQAAPNTPFNAADRAVELIALAEQRRTEWSERATGTATEPPAAIPESSHQFNNPGGPVSGDGHIPQ